MAGVGSGETARRVLTEAEVRQIVVAEVFERMSAADQYDELGHHDRGERLRREADVLRAITADS